MNVALIITSTIAILFLGEILIISNRIINEVKNYRTSREIKQYNKVFNNIEYIEDALNSFIISRFEDYKIKNIEKFDVNYITDSSQKEITKDVLSSVLETISPLFKKHLSIIYNTDVIDQIIADKVIMTVMSYVIETNSGNLSIDNTLDSNV